MSSGNILDISSWTVGTGSVTHFSAYGDGNESHRFLADDPFGNTAVVWEARPTLGDNLGGGFTGGDISIMADHNSMYRFSVWGKRTVTGTAYNGFGLTTTTGVYRRSTGQLMGTGSVFMVYDGGALNEWLLMVGFVWPSGSGMGAFHADSGIYNTSGKIADVSEEYVWETTNTALRCRNVLYQPLDAATRHRWVYPRIDLVTGDEPTVEELLSHSMGQTGAVSGGVAAPTTTYGFMPSGGATVAGWTQYPTKIISGETDGRFGLSVSISNEGDTAAIGAPDEDSVYIFTKSASGVWSEQQKITSSVADSAFGASVAVSGDGNTVVIGSPAYDSLPQITNRGIVYVYKRSGGVWTRQKIIYCGDAKIDPNHPSGEQFGHEVAISGDTIVISARFADSSWDDYDTVGGVYVHTESSGWARQQRLHADDFGNNWGFNVVDISGDTIIVGATGANSVGAAYVFTRSGETWTQQQKLTVSENSFGASVSISNDGNTAAIGSEDSVYTFVKSGATWSEQQKITPSDAEFGDQFGDSGCVSISSNGNALIVGDIYEGDPVQQLSTGAAYIFKRSGGTWTQQKRLLASDAQAGDGFGRVAISGNGNDTLVGALFADGNDGAAYFFSESPMASVSQIDFETGAGGAVVGGSVSILNEINPSGGVVVSGTAPYAYGYGISGGVVVGGDVDPTYIDFETSSGGAVTGGSASLVHEEAAHGGAVVGGSSPAAYSYPISGGAVTGGTVQINMSDSETGSGGAVTGGSAKVSLIVAEEGSGGVVVNGTASHAYGYAISGGVVVNGEADVDDSWYVPSKGAEGGDESVDTQEEDEIATHTFDAEKTFEYHAGSCVPFYWQVESRCRPVKCVIWGENQWTVVEYDYVLPTLECERKQMAIIMACTFAEVCKKMALRGFRFPIEKVLRFTQPARTGDSANPNHFDGCGTYVQEYPPVDGGSDIPLDCLDFLLEGEIESDWGVFTRVEWAGTSIANGGVEVGGDADIKTDRRSMNVTGGVVVGGTGSNYLGDFSTTWGGYSELISIEGEFTTQQGEPLLPGTGLVIDECSCDSLPIQVAMTHNLNDSLKIQQFLTRNAEEFPERITLYHNKVNYSWQANIHFQGWAADGVTQETWDFLFEWACVAEVGNIPLGNTWKWSMYVKQRNLSTGEDFDTRILLVFDSTLVCPPHLGLRHIFSLNTEELTWSFASPIGTYDANVNLNVCTDNAGIFKSPQWLRSPVFKIGVIPQGTLGRTTVTNINNDIFKDRTVLTSGPSVPVR